MVLYFHFKIFKVHSHASKLYFVPLAKLYFVLFAGWPKVSINNVFNYNIDWYCGVHSFVGKKYKQVHKMSSLHWVGGREKHVLPVECFALDFHLD